MYSITLIDYIKTALLLTQWRSLVVHRGGNMCKKNKTT